MIQYPIENDHIKFKFDYGNGGVKTELCQKVLLRVSVRELHIDTKKILLGSIWHMIKKTCTY